MPSWLRLTYGEMESLLEQAGFVVDSAQDVTDHMLPMLHAFSLLGRFPYFLGRLFGNVSKVVNAMSGVEWYKHRHVWRYNIYVASKPM
jgi:hypothetical protein